MSNMGSLIALAAAAGLAGCASAGSSLDGVDGGGGGVDAGTSDAPTGTGDAPQVTPVDAPTPCTVMTRNLLTNENFDMTPIGTGWVAAPINPMYPIITADEPAIVQSPPNKAWLGGIAQAASDVLHQDVMVPASTTSLVLTGYYEVRTAEFLTGIWDSAKIELTTPTGTVLQQVIALDNRTPTTAWTAINHPFTSPHAGQTVRLRLGSTSDATYATSFLFDSLALTATYCP